MHYGTHLQFSLQRQITIVLSEYTKKKGTMSQRMGMRKLSFERGTACTTARYKETQDKVMIRGMTPPPCPSGRASTARPVNTSRYSYMGCDSAKSLEPRGGRRRSLLLISSVPLPESVRSVSPIPQKAKPRMKARTKTPPPQVNVRRAPRKASTCFATPTAATPKPKPKAKPATKKTRRKVTTVSL